MNLRKLLSVLSACALACGFFACGIKKGEPYTPQYNNNSVPVEKRDVVASGKITNQAFLSLLERKRGNVSQPLDKSYVVSRQQSYRNHWNRVVYFEFPEFTDEIDGPGAKQIKQYYKKQYKSCGAFEDFPWLDTYEEIADNPDEVMQYRLQVYAVDLLDGFVVVNFYSESHLGGGKIVSLPAADVFDRETGAKLALGEVTALKNAAQGINQAVADFLRINDITPLKPYDVRTAKDQAFYPTNNELVLLFAPGTLAPEAYGAIQVPVAWAALAQR